MKKNKKVLHAIAVIASVMSTNLWKFTWGKRQSDATISGND